MRDLLDEQHEVMAWVCLALAVGGRVGDYLDQWPTVTLVATSLVTMLGSKYYAGVKISKDGVEIE